jgi:NAD-dependent DNA ligase
MNNDETNGNIARMKALVRTLSEAANAYYDEDREIMPNIEYDKLYDELAAIEAETGVVLAASPTQRVGYEVSSELTKEMHAYRSQKPIQICSQSKLLFRSCFTEAAWRKCSQLENDKSPSNLLINHQVDDIFIMQELFFAERNRGIL